MLRTILLACLLIAAFPARASDDIAFIRPDWSNYMMPKAVDHVAVMVFVHGWGPGGENHVTIYRSGSRQREDVVGGGKAYTVASNLDTGVSARYDAGGEGAAASLSMSGRSDAYRQSVERTAETDTALGETCTVWLLKRLEAVEKDCLTDDGILLWQVVLGGEEENSAQAIFITRRPISRSEASLPPEALQLSSWGTWTPGAAAPNDEVVLEDQLHSDKTPPNGMIVRRLGKLRFESTDIYVPSRTYSNDRFKIMVQDGNAHVSNRLDIVPLYDPEGAAPKGTATLPASYNVVLGETCQDYDMMLLMDGGMTECRTADGLILKEVQWNRGGGSSVIAVRLSRNRLATAAVAPPADLISGFH